MTDVPRASARTLERVRRDGRWGGRVTQRALPSSDAEVADLDPDVRARLAAIWRAQAATEARVATSFAVIHESLLLLEGDPGLIALAARAIDDERRHAALCEEAAGRYGGGVCLPHAELAPHRPAHASARSAEIRRALFVVGQCALNETFASAYLDAAYRGARSPLARAVLRELLADEVDHARLGWAYLHTLDEQLRRELSEWLVPLTVCNLREWRRIDLPEDDVLAAHGVPPREVALRALEEAVHELLVPGFRHVGLDTRALERWVGVRQAGCSGAGESGTPSA